MRVTRGSRPNPLYKILNPPPGRQSATQPFLVSSNNAPPHQVLSSRSGNIGISTSSSSSERLASESVSYSSNYGGRTHRLPRKTVTEQLSTKVILGVRSTFFLHLFARNFLYYRNLVLRLVTFLQLGSLAKPASGRVSVLSHCFLFGGVTSNCPFHPSVM